MIGITDLDYRIISLVRDNSEISLGYIYAKADSNAGFVKESLNKLIRKNIILSFEKGGFTYFKFSEKNKSLVNRTVKCPKCFTKRKIHDSEHLVANCINPECKLKNGARTRFWVMDRIYGTPLNDA